MYSAADPSDPRELGYGTPYLLSLGLSEQLTSLVWLAGPISGLIAQPLIGAISDSSQSQYRRRYWIVTATVLLAFSALGLAFTDPIAKSLVGLFGGGQGDWDPREADLVNKTAIAIAITCFYGLDFALNAWVVTTITLTPVYKAHCETWSSMLHQESSSQPSTRGTDVSRI
jgi:MFS family permease